MREILEELEKNALAYIRSGDLKPRDFKALAELLIDIYELRLKEGSVSGEDLASLLEKIPSKAAKKFKKVLKERFKKNG